MIRKEEIIEQAYQVKLSPNIVEKDYVLGWVLAGIFAMEELQKTWAFKGGTCLKKCYFEKYRFSEDLDFTLSHSAHLNESFLTHIFENIVAWVESNSGIILSKISFEEYVNPRGKLSVEGKIIYNGPMQRRGDAPKIKLDLTSDEVLVFKGEKRAIFHPYSDVNPQYFNVTSYSIEEIFSEKIRAMVQRLRPRDLFDVINLLEDNRWSPDRFQVLEALKKKSQFKNVPLPTLELLNSMQAKEDLVNEWEQMLSHQIYELPSYQYYWNKLPHLLEWLYT